MPPIVHLFRQKSTKHGQEVNPFSMDWGRWADGTFTILKDQIVYFQYFEIGCMQLCSYAVIFCPVYSLCCFSY